MITIVSAISVWWAISLAIGGLMVWRPIPARDTRNDFRDFARYAVN
jgi:hypothetical protein